MEAIERTSGVSRKQFLSKYLIPNRPVVVTDGLRDWAALGRWSPTFFLSTFGDIDCSVSGNFFDPEQRLSLGSFIELIDSFAEKRPADFDVRSSVPYLRLPCPITGTSSDRKKIFNLLRDDWNIPYFLPRSLYVSPFNLRGHQLRTRLFPEQSLLIAAKGACTGLHVDRTSDTALICQVSGVKAAFLFPPEETSYRRVRQEFRLRQDGTLPSKTVVSRELLSGVLPKYEGMVTYYTELRPGDVLVIPKLWPHEVFSLETTVSLTYNFMHLAGIDSKYLKYLVKEALGRLHVRYPKVSY